MKKTSIIIMVLTILSKMVGYLRELVLSATYGQSAIADAFVYTFSQPSTIFSVVVAAFVTGFIPMYTRIEAKEGRDKADDFLSNILSIMMVLGTLLSLVIFIWTEPTLKLLLNKIGPAELEIFVPFLRITIFTMLFTCIFQLFTGYLQQKGSFFFVTLLGIPMNLVVVIALVLSKKTSYWLLPWGTFVAFGLQAILILAYARIKGYSYRPILNFKDKHVRQMIILAIPLVIGALANALGALINHSLLAQTEGAIAQLNYATKLGGIVDGVFGISIVAIMYPALSRSIALGHQEETAKNFTDSLVSLLVFVLPASVGMVVFADPIIHFVYQRGALQEVGELVMVFRNYAMGIALFSLYQLLVKVFYVYQDNKTPTMTTVIYLTVQIILAIVLTPRLRTPGVTLAMTLAYGLGCVLLLVLMRKFFRQFDLWYLLGQVFRVLVAVAVMALVSHFAYGVLASRLSLRLSLVLTIGLAACLYLISIMLLKVDTVMDLLTSWRKNKEV